MRYFNCGARHFHASPFPRFFLFVLNSQLLTGDSSCSLLTPIHTALLVRSMRLLPWLNMVKHLHLFLALIFGSVFVLLGLSGSVLVWFDELDHGLNPGLFLTGRDIASASPTTPSAVQSAFAVLSRDSRYGSPQRMMIPATNAEVISAWYPPYASHPGALFQQTWSRQVFLDPVTLQIKGERNWGEYGTSSALLMPTLFHLHRYVLLGEIGRSVISISGMVLIVMVVSGLFLWFPKANRKAWRQALTVNFRASVAAILFRLHRSLGFFALPVFIVLGFSGAYFNRTQWLTPVIAPIFPITPTKKIELQPQDKLDTTSSITPAQAIYIAQGRFPEARVSRIGLASPQEPIYEIRLRQANEVHRGDGATKVSIDAHRGQIVRISDPLQGQSGDRLLSWLFPLHTGMAFGVAGRIFICCFGLLPLFMMWSGWRMWRKRHPVH